MRWLWEEAMTAAFFFFPPFFVNEPESDKVNLYRPAANVQPLVLTTVEQLVSSNVDIRKPLPLNSLFWLSSVFTGVVFLSNEQ